MKRRAPVQKKRPDRLEKLLLCESLIAPMENHLRTTGLEHREEAALITGYIAGDAIGIGMTALLPYTENRWAACSLPLDVNLGCVDFMTSAGQVLLAQVHTHPGRVCGHSHTDDDGAFSDAPGIFSLVIPLFGRHGVGHLLGRGIAIHERLLTGRWRRLPQAEVSTRFAIIPSHHVVL